jgi:hypothetical protein
MRNVPGSTPDEALRHLHSIWFDKVDESERKDKEYQKAKALLAHEMDQLTLEKARSIVAAAAQTTASIPRKLCTNPNCPRKTGHTITNCWAKGGGAEGKGPPSYIKKYGGPTVSATPIVAAMANRFTSNLDSHLLDPGDSSRDGASAHTAGVSTSNPPPNRHDNTVLGGGCETSVGSVVDTQSVNSASCCCIRKSRFCLGDLRVA